MVGREERQTLLGIFASKSRIPVIGELSARCRLLALVLEVGSTLWRLSIGLWVILQPPAPRPTWVGCGGRGVVRVSFASMYTPVSGYFLFSMGFGDIGLA